MAVAWTVGLIMNIWWSPFSVQNVDIKVLWSNPFDGNIDDGDGIEANLLGIEHATSLLYVLSINVLDTTGVIEKN